MLQQRAAGGRPIRVGLIGAGSSARCCWHRPSAFQGSTSWGSPISMSARRAPRSPASAGRPSATAPQAWATRSRPARPASSTMRALARMRRDRVHRRSDRSSYRGCPACACGHRRRQTPHHGQCRSRRALRSASAARARAKNLVYSMAYGDQPAIICELVDWVRSCGFELTSAGKG